MIAASVKMPHLPVKALLLKFLPVRGGTIPIINVPSTAGTGAEVTVGAVVTNEHGSKGSTVLIGLNVTHVVLDSELTVNAPNSVTAACGMDALSHCIEGAVSDTEVDEDDMEMSMEGVRLIMQKLPVVMQDIELVGEAGDGGALKAKELPEEKRIDIEPVEGDYVIRAHYYASHQQTVFGPATCTLTVYTDWGRPGQRQEITTTRLDKERSMVPVGTVSYGAAAVERAESGDAPEPGELPADGDGDAPAPA
jgi:hypothetical protein